MNLYTLIVAPTSSVMFKYSMLACSDNFIKLKILADCLEVGNLKLRTTHFCFINIKNGSHLTLDIETGIEVEY